MPLPIIAYNSNVHFAWNDPFSHLRSHICTGAVQRPSITIWYGCGEHMHAVFANPFHPPYHFLMGCAAPVALILPNELFAGNATFS